VLSDLDKYLVTTQMLGVHLKPLDRGSFVSVASALGGARLTVLASAYSGEDAVVGSLVHDMLFYRDDGKFFGFLQSTDKEIEIIKQTVVDGKKRLTSTGSLKHNSRGSFELTSKLTQWLNTVDPDWCVGAQFHLSKPVTSSVHPDIILAQAALRRIACVKFDQYANEGTVVVVFTDVWYYVEIEMPEAVFLKHVLGLRVPCPDA